MAVIQYSGSVTKSNWKGSSQNTATDSVALSEAGSRRGWEGWVSGREGQSREFNQNIHSSLKPGSGQTRLKF